MTGPVFSAGPLTMKLVFEPHGMTNLHDLQAVLDAVELALQPRSLTLPQNADEAELMEKVGFGWIKEHAPERLTESGQMREFYRWQDLPWEERLTIPTARDDMVLVRKQNGRVNDLGEPGFDVVLAYRVKDRTWRTSPYGEPIGGYEQWCEIPR